MNTDEIFEKAETLCVLATQEPDTYSDEYTFWNKEAQKLEHQGWKTMQGKTTRQNHDTPEESWVNHST